MLLRRRKDSSHWLFEWSSDGKQFYPINYKNIENIRSIEGYKYRRDVMDAVLNGLTILCSANYNKETGILMLKIPEDCEENKK